MPYAMLKANNRDVRQLKGPSLTITLCAPNEKHDEGNLGQKELSDNTKVHFGATKNHG